MIEACAKAGVKLMTAYRLHFEKANLTAIEIVKSGRLGKLRLFNSVFNMQVEEGNVRLDREAGGGTLYDIGIYCINAARNLFRAEPDAVQAWSVRGSDERFREVDEATSAVLHFSDARIATFTCSFGAARVAQYQIAGTDGDLRVDPAYHYTGALKHYLTIEGKTTRRTFPERDQFSPELIYFSNCILKNREPEPSGEEGLADLRVIEALYRSADSGERVELPPFERTQRPTPDQEIRRPPVEEPELVHAESPSANS
jgi:glucose-fructose oxidoreductase